ncbi:recombinase RecR [Methylacidiphilum kamchatkense Kam1]|uniref:Recombination protein RecR n=1 Tax=Methylacidiphilum kamchatkense Kam1 TaxID=1202785 RepID=A0A0C1RKW1_9BACT|nr:recombination mediator RecR [Methylacidiphilum kamchatkense]KIE58677.1 recombinase RecR [Methylacidiphilum kamchatkense Kam1]QDQ41935.1 DNA replication and repair protein RecR [Methylacidiphilum kamchatkense Kam1]
MIDFPPVIRNLIEALKELPAIGPRSAERIILYLLEENKGTKQRLMASLRELETKITLCSRCGFYSEEPLCQICQDPSRDLLYFCVVIHPVDVLKIERTGAFRGVYHVLGKKISPLEGHTPEDLPIAHLIQRIDREKPREVILAFGTDAEAEATALFVSQILKKRAIKVSSLAMGLPAGSGLEYADSVTLSYALSGRREL